VNAQGGTSGGSRSGLSSPDKVLWPDAGITKGDLADYYAAAADRLLPHLRRRPLTLRQHPRGVAEQGFFIKNLPRHAPAHISRFEAWTESSNRTVAYALADDAEDLAWFAQQNAVELHAWTSTADRPDRPDQLWFDLDPSTPQQSVAEAARWLRAVLGELGLQALVKTSGKRGLHLLVPVERRYDFSELRGFGLAIARACAAEHPEALTVEMRKAERDGRLLLDWSRNGAAQTVVAAWSPRTDPRATVSMPLSWDELDDLDPGRFTLRSVPQLLQRADPWGADPSGAAAVAPQRIETARAALEAMGFPSEDRSPRARTS